MEKSNIMTASDMLIQTVIKAYLTVKAFNPEDPLLECITLMDDNKGYERRESMFEKYKVKEPLNPQKVNEMDKRYLADLKEAISAYVKTAEQTGAIP